MSLSERPWQLLSQETNSQLISLLSAIDRFDPILSLTQSILLWWTVLTDCFVKLLLFNFLKIKIFYIVRGVNFLHKLLWARAKHNFFNNLFFMQDELLKMVVEYIPADLEFAILLMEQKNWWD